jgi:hypothetical protein
VLVQAADPGPGSGQARGVGARRRSRGYGWATRERIATVSRVPGRQPHVSKVVRGLAVLRSTGGPVCRRATACDGARARHPRKEASRLAVAGVSAVEGPFVGAGYWPVGRLGST